MYFNVRIENNRQILNLSLREFRFHTFDKSRLIIIIIYFGSINFTIYTITTQYKQKQK